MNTDPIADLLTRIRNACRAGLAMLELPSSKLKVEVVKLLLAEGYIRSFELREDKDTKLQMLRVLLKYDTMGYPVIRSIRRWSRPGSRKYYKATKIPRILGGAGVAILSTSLGILPDHKARKENVGGELLCTIY
jgi:small subunit ribosomal protein S8